MLRRILLIAMLSSLLVGLAQARVYDDSKAVVPGSDLTRANEQPIIARHVPPRGDLSRAYEQPIIARHVPPRGDSSRANEQPIIARHVPPRGDWSQGYNPLSWGVWMLMKSFGGGN